MAYRIKELRQRSADLTSEARTIVDRAIAESRDLSAAECARRDKLFAELERVDGEIRLEEASMDRERVATGGARSAAPGQLPTLQSSSGDGAGSRFTSIGEMLQAVHRASVPDAGVVDPRLVRAAATGLGTNVPSDGGFAVDRPIAQGLLERVYQIGEVSKRVFHLPISEGADGTKINAIDETSRVNGSRWGGVQAYWVSQASQIPASKPKMRQIELGARKLAALYYATEEELQDSMVLSAVAERVVPQELNFVLEDAIISGLGSGMPLGILNSTAPVTVTKEGGQASGTFNYANVTKMWSRMWAASRKNAVWLINQDVEPQLLTMSQVVGTGGVPVYLPANGAADAPFATLFGRPVIPVEYCSTLGTAGDVILADLTQYVLAQKGGIKAAASMHVRFLYDEQVFRFTMRVDGQPTWRTPVTPKNGTNTLSPFVILETR